MLWVMRSAKLLKNTQKGSRNTLCSDSIGAESLKWSRLSNKPIRYNKIGRGGGDRNCIPNL